MTFDAIIVAGGRARRLGGVDKAALQIGGESLIARACHAARAAEQVVLVGDIAKSAAQGAIITREDPPYGGPAAAIGAGVAALGDEAAEWLLVVACDMPDASVALPALLAAAAEQEADALLADAGDGRRQPLLAMYRTSALTSTIADKPNLTNLPVWSLIDRLNAVSVPVPPASTVDVDTWDDAGEFGIIRKD